MSSSPAVYFILLRWGLSLHLELAGLTGLAWLVSPRESSASAFLVLGHKCTQLHLAFALFLRFVFRDRVSLTELCWDSHRSTCLCFPGTEIKGVRLHARPVTLFFYVGAEDLNSGPQAHVVS